jgi:8-oxo-dGTP pyrophosphatase MutT (NUDIX family)
MAGHGGDMNARIRPHHIHEDVIPATSKVHIRQYAVIRDARNNILLLQHGRSGHYAEIWTLPGGKLLSTEPHIEGISRECREEIGFIPVFAPGVLPYSHAGDLCLFYRAHPRGSPGILLSPEHIAYAWKPVEELDTLKFRSAIMPDAVRKLMALKI